MANYNLGFISDEDFLTHVSNTIDKYRFDISLDDFNRNIVDPIKMTFDAKVYGRSVQDVVRLEIARQIDKSNANHIGYFHQNIFNYVSGGWEVPRKGFDVINEELGYYAEIKNKHNTMNSSSAGHLYTKMQDLILQNDRAVCYLVEVIAKKSQDIPWRATLKGIQYNHERIRRISIDKFYELVTGDASAFKKVCDALPRTVEDAMGTFVERRETNTVIRELEKIHPDLIKSIFLMSFERYEGFGNFDD